jgi:N-acyl-D-aspartate/D-glutamate deacylase
VAWDLLIRDARVVDGTGMPAFAADVAVAGSRVARIGRVREGARRVVDAGGRVLAPGFIDVHTHYDVQLDWDPLATPSCFHGVTTVIAGNCGFTLAPAKPEDVPWLAAMLSRVEGMSQAALAAGFRFGGGSFGDFWRRHEGSLGVNAGSYVGHCAVRRHVMGEAASERAATPAEIVAMQELVRASMREGALGFSSSQLEIHADEQGRGVPCNHAAPEEIVALCAVLAEFDRGAIEFIPRTLASGYSDEDRALILEMYRVSGRPIELAVLVPTPAHPLGWQRVLDFVHEAREQGVRLHPQFTTNRLELHLKLADTFAFDEMPVWREVLTQPEPERSRRLRDPAWRARMRTAWADPTERAVTFDLGDLEVEAVRDASHADWVGRSVHELAQGSGMDAFDRLFDLALAEDLQTSFRTRTPEIGRKFMHHVVGTSVRDPLVMAGSSDGGAHLGSFTGADYTTRLLSEWVPDALTLEQAIWRLTGMPATVHGLVDRGFLRVGARADLVLFDPEALDASPARLVRDFPGDTERYVTDAKGYALQAVNGVVLLEDGVHTGALPGEVLRGG